MKLVLYSIGCPKCNTLEKKLNKEGMDYVINPDMTEVAKKGFQSAPILKVVDEDQDLVEYLEFNDAVRWINNNK